ncbi:MAG: metal-dependent hydrolase, partial [Chlorobiaceae bacterium]|nr:metal-dependent hydrolase [Chlorobiaceae bacterium]
MVLGHLPVGYIISKMLFRTINARQATYRTFMFWGLFGSIAPDTDMIY